MSVQAFHRAWLFAFVCWLGLPLGALGFVLLRGLVGGAFWPAVRRELDAMVLTMPLMALLFVPLLLGLGSVYAWAAPAGTADQPLAAQAWYLNETGFVLRGAVVLVVWSVLAWLLVRASARRGAISAAGAILYVATGTLAAVDWVMSLEPQWTSRVFALLFLIGHALGALALAICVAARASLRPGRALAPKTLRDLGNLLLAFLLLWGYLAFVQLLVAWHADLPHEAEWYVRRTENGWQWVAAALAVQFLVPFVLLLFRSNKEDARRLSWIAGAVLLLRVLDDCWTVLPALGGVHWLDVVVVLAMGALLLLVFARGLRRLDAVRAAGGAA